jgi:hypothetical protein
MRGNFVSALNNNIIFFWNIQNEFYEKKILDSEVIWNESLADIYMPRANILI